MSNRLAALRIVVLLALAVPIAGGAYADDKPPVSKSRIIRYDEARPMAKKADWGEMRFYFLGETANTKDVLTAVATVQPGKAAHKSHRHAMEEYLVVLEGGGEWSLDGKQMPAKKGDMLYVEPWVYHGLTNTGDTPLVFLVIRYNGKGVAVPPRPDNRPDEEK